MGVSDYIIIGQGLAGSALASILLEKRAKIHVLHDLSGESSSMIAAGLYNPVTGRKMVKTWKAEILFPELIRFYRKIEQRSKRRFLYDIPIYRPFNSIREQNEWMGKSSSDAFRPFIQGVRTNPEYAWSRDPYGGIVLRQSGFLDIPEYLDAIREMLVSEGVFCDTRIDLNSISVQHDQVQVGEFCAKKIIFCDGPQVTQNPYFNWLPFRPVKGEVLEIQMDIEMEEVLNRGIFIIPLGKNMFRVGSTYDNNDLTWEPTEQGRQQVEDKLIKLIREPYRVKGHRAGIRPATADRRPMLGRHPTYETLFLFNGLGTKGVSLSPYFAGQLVDYMESGIAPDDEVNISRYFSLY